MATMTPIKHIFIYLLSFEIGSFCFALNWWLWTRGHSISACATIQLESTWTQVIHASVSTSKTPIILRVSSSFLALWTLFPLHILLYCPPFIREQRRDLCLCADLWVASRRKSQLFDFLSICFQNLVLWTIHELFIWIFIWIFLASCHQTHRHLQMSPQSFLVSFFSV